MLEQQLQEYLAIYKNNPDDKRLNKMMQSMFEFFDKLILGVIFNVNYKLYLYADLDDLLQEGRLALLTVIHKQTFNRTKGTLFNFFSTVVYNNLMNYIRKNRKIVYNEVSVEIFQKPITYNHNYYIDHIVDDALNELYELVKGKKKLEELTLLLKHYYSLHGKEKFLKKNFIQFAKAYNYSPATINNFFTCIKKLRNKKNIKELIGE